MNKGIQVADLIQLLSNLKPGARVEVNAVGNLMVLDSSGKYVGFVDIRSALPVIAVDSDAMMAERAK